MKHLLLLAFFCATVSIQAATPPAAVAAAFKAKYPSAIKLHWGKESSDKWEAEFRLGAAKISVNFKTDGTWVETETIVGTDQLPSAVQATLRKLHPDAKIVSAEKTESPKEGTHYELRLSEAKKVISVEINEDGALVNEGKHQIQGK